MELFSGNLSEKKVSPERRQVKLLVLGSGPAGLAAALYAARAELQPVVLTGMALGGQAATTGVIENYPGFPEGVGGSDLGDLFQRQAERFGAEMVFGSAIGVDLKKAPFIVESDAGYIYMADSLIIATGADPVHLNVPGEKELSGKGVSYCATCDGWFFKDKELLVVGGGDSALEEALFLTRYASKITIVHRRDQLRAGAILQKRAMENPKISFLWNSVIKQIEGSDKVTGALVEDVLSHEQRVVPADGVFVFIGHSPNTGLFKDQLQLDAHGFIVTDIRRQTSVPGVFSAGEASDALYRQVITSAGMGAEAAIQAGRYLESLEVIS